MVRRYEEPIEVRAEPVALVGSPRAEGTGAAGVGTAGVGAAGVGAGADVAPSAFIWRGRLYVVREVLGHWRERRAWWREALDESHRTESHRVESHRTGSRSAEPSRPHGTARAFDDPLASEQLEQEVWRVAASPGRMRATGVYDLGRDRQWRLLRVAD